MYLRKITLQRYEDEVINIVHQCALLYKENLANRNLLFVVDGDSSSVAGCFGVHFQPQNFLHLTGFKSNLPAADFFEATLNNEIGINQIGVVEDNTADMKLDVLPQLMNIHKVARMVGDYDNSSTLLVTDKLAGTVAFAMGFVDIGGIYVPNTVLKKDLRKITNRPRRRILAMFIKETRDEKYKTLTYIAKGITIDDESLIPILKEKCNISEIKADFEIPRKPLDL
jgi:hypothetical protein